MNAIPAKPIRVILADDHPILRAGIREALRELPGLEVTGEVNDGREAIEMVKAQQPDIVFEIGDQLLTLLPGERLTLPGLLLQDALKRVCDSCAKRPGQMSAHGRRLPAGRGDTAR